MRKCGGKKRHLALVRSSLRIVSQDFIVGPFVQGRKGIHAAENVFDFLDKALVVPTTQAFKAFAKGVDDASVKDSPVSLEISRARFSVSGFFMVIAIALTMRVCRQLGTSTFRFRAPSCLVEV
jgi:hypothetical protein